MIDFQIVFLQSGFANGGGKSFYVKKYLTVQICIFKYPEL